MTTVALPPENAGALAEAERAVELVSVDPRQAFRLATGLLAAGGIGPEGRAVAERAAALAELEFGRVPEARARFESARDRGLADGVFARVAEIQIGLAVVLLECEEPDAAMAEIDAALALARDEATLGKVQSQRATILMRLGRYGEALEQATTALATCRSAGLSGPVARLLSNQGIVHAYLGDYVAAERELRQALELLRRQGADLGAANVVHNLGFVAARRGDVPAALANFDAAFAEYQRLDVPCHEASIDRCEVLLAARLLPEARTAIEAVVAGLARAGQAADLAEARLIFAEAALAGGDLDTSRSQAELAEQAFRRQGRPSWAALARFVAWRASATDPTGDDLEMGVTEAAELAGELEAAGWQLQGLEARIIGARWALRAGEPTRASSILSGAGAGAGAGAAGALVRAAGGMTEAGWSADARVRIRYALALAHLATDDRGAAMASLREGLQIAEEHRAALGATELRARAGLQAADLAGLGLELAVAAGDAAEVFEWSEHWRGNPSGHRRSSPPPDAELAEQLTTLRHTVAAHELLVQAGENGGAEADLLARRRRLIEAGIRHRCLASGRQYRSSPPIPGVAQVQEALRRSGSAAIVELVAVGGGLHAVVCSGTSCVVRSVAPVSELDRWGAALRFGLGRLVAGRGSRSSLVAAAEVVQRAAASADALLFGAIGADLEAAWTTDRSELVIVPTGSLHALPWGLLPSLRGRPVSVAPSAALFLSRLETSPASPHRPTVLVAAPGLSSAGAEVEGIQRLYPSASSLTGAAATSADVAALLTGAGVAHVVAHGSFRRDNPLFSALDLADGPLTVYELEALGAPPELLVLSACDAGRSDVQPGDELMGLAAAMLSLGSRAIVASVVPVPDAGAPAVMVALHTHLRAGHPPAVALSLVQASHQLGAFSPSELAERSLPVQRALAGAGFVCLGSGGRPAAPASLSEVPARARMRGDRVAAKMTK